MASTALAGEILARLDEVFAAAADANRAAAMRAYMREQFSFLGIPAPWQRQLARAVLAATPTPAEADLVAVATHCWQRDEREYQYFACDLLRRHVNVCGADFVSTVQHLVTTKPWWDTVDAIAAHVVGPLVSFHPQLTATMDEWSVGTDLWLARAAILHQLRYREHTDERRLFAYCLSQAERSDFFIRKAIGWALREYAKTAPASVRSFVHTNRSRLSPLSVRESLKNL